MYYVAMEIVREQTGQAGCSKSPSSKAAGESKPEAYPLGYVEDFDEQRTKLAGFFSILPLEAGDAVGNRVLGQVGGGMNVQLLHDTELMELHRFHRHIEDRGDLLRAATLGDEL